MDALCKPPYNALRLAQASAMQFSHCAWCGLYAETSDIVRSQCTGSIVCTRHSFTLSAEINQEGGRDRTSIHTMSPIYALLGTIILLNSYFLRPPSDPKVILRC